MSNAGDDMRGTDDCSVQKEQLQVQYTIIPAQSPSEPSYVLKTSTGTKGFMAQTILDQEGFPVDPRLTSSRVAVSGLPERTGPLLPVQDSDHLLAHQSKTTNGYVINVQRFAACSDMKEEPLSADWKERQSSDNYEWKERDDSSRKEGSGNGRGSGINSSSKRRSRSPESSTRGRSPRRRRRSRSRSSSRSRSRSRERRRSRSRSRERRRSRSRSRRRRRSRSRSRERRRSRSRSKGCKRSSSSFVDAKTESSRKKCRDHSENSPWREDVGTSEQKVLLSNGDEIVINVPNKPSGLKKNRTASWKPESTEPVESVVKKSTHSFFKKFWEKHSLAKADEMRTEQEVKNSTSPTNSTSPEERVPISLEHLNSEDEIINVLADKKNHNSSPNKNNGEAVGKSSSIIHSDQQIAQPEHKNEETNQKTLVDVAFKHKKKLLAPLPREKKKGPVVLKIKTAEDQLEDIFKKTKVPRFDETDLNDYVLLVDEQVSLTELDDFPTLFVTFKERYCKQLCHLEFYIHERKDISEWGEEQLKKRIGTLFIQFIKMECSATAVEDSFHCGCEMIVSMDEMKSLKLLDDKGLNQILDPTFTDCQAVVNVPSSGASQTCCASALKKNLRMIQGEPKIFCGMHSKRIQAHKGCPCGIFPVDVQLLIQVEKGFVRCLQGHFYHEACFLGCPHEPCKPSRSAILRPSAAK